MSIGHETLSGSSHSSGLTARRRGISAAEIKANRRAQHQRRLVAWRRTFSRFLPFTGWRVPVLVESAVAALSRQMGLERIVGRGRLALAGGRTTTLGIDFDRCIWR